MLSLEDAWRGDQPYSAGAKHWRGVPHAEGLKLNDFLIKRPVHLRQIYGRVHPQHPLQVRGREDGACVLLKAPRELRNALRGQGEARRLRVPAKALKEVADPRQRLEQVKALDGTPRTHAHSLL